MPFKKGKSGNPNGRPKDHKEFRDALRYVLCKNGTDAEAGKPKRLVSIAEQLVVAAEKGDAWAVREVIDRTDGKPEASLNVTDNRPDPQSERVSETAEWIEGSTGIEGDFPVKNTLPN